MIGSRLVSMLDKDKYEIIILSRSSRPSANGVTYAQWNTKISTIEGGALDGAYAIINLAGAGIADKRWTDARKEVILQSRTDAASTLCKAMASLELKPNLYIGASAIGYYGHQSDTIVNEAHKPGEGFLSDVCVKWEEENIKCAPYAENYLALRIGIVLSTQGGALKEILKSSVTGVYGYFGDGSTYYAWIHIDDLCRMIIWSIENENQYTVYNGTANEPVTIKELVKAVKKAKSGFGPVVPVPAFGLKIALGEMATMLLTSMRVVPENFNRENFKFEFTDPVSAIKDLIERKI